MLKIYPDYEEGYQKASFFYHEILFDFSKAHYLNRSWKETHPDDLYAQIEFAEKQFTTTHFDESLNSITSLLVNPLLDSRLKIVLHTIEVADLVAVGDYEKIQSRLEELQLLVSSESVDFTIGWSFLGVKQFINQYKPLSPYRKWLLSLFGVMEGKTRGAIYFGIQTVAEEARDLFEKQ